MPNKCTTSNIINYNISYHNNIFCVSEINHLITLNYNTTTHRDREFPARTEWTFKQQQTAVPEGVQSLDVCFQNAVCMFLGPAFVSAT